MVVWCVLQLQRIERVSQDEYKIENVLSVSFADLIIPKKEEKNLTASIEISKGDICMSMKSLYNCLSFRADISSGLVPSCYPFVCWRIASFSLG